MNPETGPVTAWVNPRSKPINGVKEVALPPRRVRYTVQTTDDYNHRVDGTGGFVIEGGLLRFRDGEGRLTAFPVANVRCFQEG